MLKGELDCWLALVLIGSAARQEWDEYSTSITHYRELKVATNVNKHFIFVNRFFYPDESATSQMLTDLAFYLAERDYKIVVITGRQLIDNPRADLRVRSASHGCRMPQSLGK